MEEGEGLIPSAGSVVQTIRSRLPPLRGFLSPRIRTHATLLPNITAAGVFLESMKVKVRTMKEDMKECIKTLAVVSALVLALVAVAVWCGGCATKTSSVDGTGVQANQYTGLTVFSGSMVSIAQGMEFLDVYEDVSTSWWNFGRYNYKRRTTWASSTSNTPPVAIDAAFRPNVATEVLFSTSVVTNAGSVITITETAVAK